MITFDKEKARLRFLLDHPEIGNFKLTNNVSVWRKNNPEKEQAQRLVFILRRNGSLKKENCQVCKNEKSECHHHDYSKPNEIFWLCKRHHGPADVARRNKEKIPFDIKPILVTNKSRYRS